MEGVNVDCTLPTRRWSQYDKVDKVPVGLLRFAGALDTEIPPDLLIAGSEPLRLPEALIQELLRCAWPVVVQGRDGSFIVVGNVLVALMAWAHLPASFPLSVVLAPANRKGNAVLPAITWCAVARGLLGSIVRETAPDIVRFAPTTDLAAALSGWPRSTCAYQRSKYTVS